MRDKKIEIDKDVNGIANIESGVTINQYFYTKDRVTFPQNNDKFIDKEKIEEYPFYRNIEEDKYICQKGKISIEANLPKVNFPMSFLIDCNITFILENGQRLIIQLDNEATLKELFSFYMFEENNKKDSQIITFELNNVTFEISIRTFNTLINISEDLQEVYTERIIQLEEKLESKGFCLSAKYQNGFELCEISYKLWIKIQQFIRKHIMRDISNSNKGEWDIFHDSNSTYFIWTDNTIINHSLRYNYNYFLDIKEPIRIVLVWNTLNSYDIINKNE